MRKLIALLLTATLLLVPTAATANAAPAEQGCKAGVTTQYDLAGYYMAADASMQVGIYPCGGSYVEWYNAYGKHTAAYVTILHLPDGVIATGMQSSTGYLDNSNAIGYKAAEPGYIQVITDVGVYKLRKMY